MPTARQIGKTINPNGKILGAINASQMDQIKSNQLYPERADKGFAYRAMLRMKQRREQKRPFWLFRPFIAILKLMGLIVDEPSHKVEAVMPSKKKQINTAEVNANKPSLFSWEGLVRLLGPIGAALVIVFCVLALGITFWNWVAGVAFIIVCGCLPVLIIGGVGGYLAFQKAMNKRDEEDEGEEEEKE